MSVVVEELLWDAIEEADAGRTLVTRRFGCEGVSRPVACNRRLASAYVQLLHLVAASHTASELELTMARRIRIAMPDRNASLERL